MEKKVTKEEVERVLEQYLTPITKEPILNELFPTEFKVGDWVVVTKKVTTESRDLDGKTVKLTRVKPFCVSAEKTDRLAGMKYDEVRHATPEEIADAEWEEGKVYKVYSDDGDYVRISTEKVGHFYNQGRFKSITTTKYDKYEKL